jgi:hypothetical protein
MINSKWRRKVYENSIKPMEKSLFEIFKYIEQHYNDNTAYKDYLNEAKKNFEDGFDLIRTAIYRYSDDKYPELNPKAIRINPKCKIEGLDKGW